MSDQQDHQGFSAIIVTQSNDIYICTGTSYVFLTFLVHVADM